MTSEGKRLQEARDGVPWRAWGPYLSERQWGTVREDYSDDGDAWSYFSHDQARSRAYHWGEDGLAGISDEKQQLCFALALWNGRDPIIKERLFGLTNAEGNHGEDVKEYYFYVDNLPTHSYQRWLYKYPHAEFPYADLVDTNARKSRHDMEYELLDTGVFDEDKYFDVEVEHVKLDPEDILCRITVHNRSTETRVVARAAHAVVPQHVVVGATHRQAVHRTRRGAVVPDREGRARRPRRASISTPSAEPSSCSARTRRTTRASGAPRRPLGSRRTASTTTSCTVRRRSTPRTKARRWRLESMVTVAGGDQATTLVRLTRRAPESLPEPFADADELFSLRRAEADEFYESITPPGGR